ncbi:hypothetical protein TWF217_003595 [Orbilia oligospora]|nr:hypothetical protein TWF217_003595 [Orbilia oligospora]
MWSHIKWNPDSRVLNWSAFDKSCPGTSRGVTQETEDPTFAIAEDKVSLQHQAPGASEKKTTQRLMNIKRLHRGYEPGFISGGPAKTVQKSSTCHTRMRTNIPSYSVTALGGLCPSKYGGWSERHLVSGYGDIAIPSENPAAKLLQRELVTSSLCAVGRIFDPVTGCSGSGFWIEGGYFCHRASFCRMEHRE